MSRHRALLAASQMGGRGNILITFNINGVDCIAEEGMIWSDWMLSQYFNDTINMQIKNSRIYVDGDPLFRNSLNGLISQYAVTEIQNQIQYNSM